jgi:N-acetylglucosamine kinase-like BadF-type ATPase
MSLYLCVDCGGSKTSAVICDASGQVLGRALGGPSNFAYLGPAAFEQAVITAVSDALKTCISPPSVGPVSLPPKDPALHFAAAWFGVSGVDSPADIAAVTALTAPLLGLAPGPRLTVANDTHLLVAPLALHPDISTAVACIGGTGSIAVSFRRAAHAGALEELGRLGGWGWLLGDEGGGFHVGREAVRTIMRKTDEASLHPGAPPEPSSMTRRVLEFFGETSPFGLLTAVHRADPDGTAPLGSPAYYLMAREKRLSTLAPLVFAAAFEDGDPLALDVLKNCAGTLADQIAVLLEPDIIPVSMRPAGTGAPGGGEGGDPLPVVIKADGQDAPITLQPDNTATQKPPTLVPAVNPPISSASPPSNAIKAKDSILCFGGSLVGQESYRKLVLDALAKKGHVFKYVEFVDDAAKVGALGLAKAANTPTDG